MEGRMKVFPIPPSMTTSAYGIFEYLTLDIIRLTNISRTLLRATLVALRTAFVLSQHTTTLQFVTGALPWTSSAIPLITSRASTRRDLVIKFSQSFGTVLLFQVLPCMSRRAGHFTRVRFSAKPSHVKAAHVSCSVMPTRMSTIRSRTHTSF
jgi:hypothetical protein